MRRSRFVLVALLAGLVIASACGDDGVADLPVDAGVDAMPRDAGIDVGPQPDAPMDAPVPEAGPDAPPADAGVDADAAFPRPEERLVEIMVTDEDFNPSQLFVLPETPLILRLRNQGSVAHSLAVELPGGTVMLDDPVPPEETGELRVDAPAAEGDVAFFDPTGDFRESGLEGVMTVTLPPMVELEEVASGLNSPVAMALPGDGTGRRFLVDQVGQIRILAADGTLLETPFLDIQDRIVELEPDFDERGLLGLAFHPDYATNGRFFVYYSAPLRDSAPDDWNNTSTISEFTVSDADPDQADPTSERILLQVDQPQFNHAGGTVAFGPDELLYISLGDGGGANDVGLGHTEDIGNAQDITKLLGSMLRIDVDGGDPYGIPDDNPFVGMTGEDEIFAYGFRNPYRFSFDTGGDQSLFVGDSGQDLWEEIDIVTLGGNYGWNIREGTHCFDPDEPMMPPATCPTTGPSGEPLIPPIIEMPHVNQEGGLALVIVGGHVYRGTALPALEGSYVFSAWSQTRPMPRGRLFIASEPDDEGDLWPFQTLGVEGDPRGVLERFVLGFGRDADGELYVLTTDTVGPTGETGAVFQIVP